MKLLELLMSGISFLLISTGGATTIIPLLDNSTTTQVQSINPNSIAPNVPVSSHISQNWAGYAAQNGTYTAVGASWSVPNVSSTGQDLEGDATWVGIGGMNTRDLIQSGTQAIVEGGEIQYAAWVETLPDALEQIPIDVNAGDSVSVSLTQVNDTTWHLTFINNTTGKIYNKNISYESSRSSAEWIEEMPVVQSGRFGSYLPLTNFGKVQFQNAYAVKDGQRVDIASSGAQSLTMVDSDFSALATPSDLTNGNSFSVSRNTENTAAVPSYVFSDTQSLPVSTHRHHHGQWITIEI